MIAPGRAYHYGYDIAGNLASVKYPDNKTRLYVYNEPANTSGANLPNALTGIIDENGNRFATYQYDASGRAITSQHNVAVGATSTPVEKSSIVYTNNASGDVTSSAVTDALNTTRTYTFSTILGVAKNTGISQPCSACGSSAANAQTYDTNGNVSSRTDFKGNKTSYVYDLTRNLETSRTEGLTSASATTPQTRTITTQWHATYRLPTLITEPGRTTAFSYDANGNLLSKTITDTALNRSSTWTYTYNALGQVLTADGPRTDVSDVTTYTYYSSASTTTGAVHSIGDLATVTNALGHVTSITDYDLNGRPLSITDPNGVVTALTYYPRGWLHTRTVNGAQTTTYDYDGVGQLTKATLPDGSFLSYTYDTAHRLTDIADNAGNTIHYTLDAMGNRTQENTKDATNALKQTRSRIYDALSRLQKDIGGTSPATQITQYGYDNNGNLQSITDPLGHVTTNGFDALNRLITVTDPQTPTNGVTTTTYNALDQVTAVSDPRLVTTNYTIDALGNVSATQSPDSGTTANLYDAAGNLTQKTDARGIVTTYMYDALNRLIEIDTLDDTLLFVYDFNYFDNYELGHLTYLQNNDGLVIFVHDAYGNVTAKADWLNSETFTAETGYSYDNANRVVQMTYPSGRIVSYTRNALGQITAVDTQDDGNAPPQSVISSASYEPFGPLKALTFASGATTTIAHDLDYRVSRITTTSTPNWDYVYGYDVDGNITALADQVGTLNRSYSYDAVDRLLTDSAGSGYQYQYDLNGNRTQIKIGALPASQTYAATSNRLATYFGTSYSHDAAGNRSVVGATSYSYDGMNRLATRTQGATTVTYRYNPLGERFTKRQASGDTHYDYRLDGKYLTQQQLDTNGNTTQLIEYLWLDDTPIAQIKTSYSGGVASGRRLTYIHADHLNTPRFMTDASRTIVWRWDSMAYGINAPNTNPDGDGIVDTLDLRFPGQIADAESGLFYNINRYYDPTTGRYTQSDPIGLEGGLNTYAYVDGNPISFTDPNGLQIAQGVAAIRAAPKVLRALGEAAAVVASMCSNDKSCPPCTPYPAGTKGWTRLDTGHTHFPIMGPHLHVRQVNQRKSDCKCFWNVANPDVAAPPPPADWIDLTNGETSLSP